jgi:hypothetical protein
MSDPHVHRSRSASRRSRAVRDAIDMFGRDLASTSVPAEERDTYRAILAGWPQKWRERWGRRANALEDLGLSWRTAELKAFTEVGEERRRKTEGSPDLSSSLAGRN